MYSIYIYIKHCDVRRLLCLFHPATLGTLERTNRLGLALMP